MAKDAICAQGCNIKLIAIHARRDSQVCIISYLGGTCDIFYINTFSLWIESQITISC